MLILLEVNLFSSHRPVLPPDVARPGRRMQAGFRTFVILNYFRVILRHNFMPCIYSLPVASLARPLSIRPILRLALPGHGSRLNFTVQRGMLRSVSSASR